MNYRNDLSCRKKMRYDMESAAARWDTHPAQAMYICEVCRFLHFATSNVPRMDRYHEEALRYANHISNGVPPKAFARKIVKPREKVKPEWRELKIRKPSFSQYLGYCLPKPNPTTCKTCVWKNISNVSLSENEALKDWHP